MYLLRLHYYNHLHSALQAKLIVDVILLVAEFCSLVDIRALSLTCCQLQRLCTRLHMRQLGILHSGSTTTEIRLVGGPFLAPSVSLLPFLTCDTPRISIIIDFYHITTFLC